MADHQCLVEPLEVGPHNYPVGVKDGLADSALVEGRQDIAIAGKSHLQPANFFRAHEQRQVECLEIVLIDQVLHGFGAGRT